MRKKVSVSFENSLKKEGRKKWMSVNKSIVEVRMEKISTLRKDIQKMDNFSI